MLWSRPNDNGDVTHLQSQWIEWKSVKEWTSKFRGIGCAGKLTQKTIKSIQGHYNGAIHDHCSDTTENITYTVVKAAQPLALTKD